MRQLINKKHGDGFDDWIDINNDMFGYSDTRLKWPEIDDIYKERKEGIGLDVSPNWFYNLFAGTQSFSELNAITLYRYDVNQLSDIDESKGEIITAFSGISFVEMGHYDHFQELILSLSGDINSIQYNNSELVNLKNSSTDYMSALDTAIRSENDTIDEINRIVGLLNNCQPSRTKTICEEILSKQLADEKWHIMIFDNLRKMY